MCEGQCLTGDDELNKDRLIIPYIRFRSETGKKWEFRRLNPYPLEYDCRECCEFKKCPEIETFRTLQKDINAKLASIHLKKYQPRQLTLDDKNIEDALWKEIDRMFRSLPIEEILKCLRKRNYLQRLFVQDRLEYPCFM